ncbi:hypothetical protein BKA64DRAFT_461575 [Cadophora sp. MPI-SDFR-AT-0126]|nr:hypothetical protein BKA64DRAFT_461575 [Leotiomycetes sp. MPI-SDFR-AT-0126]
MSDSLWTPEIIATIVYRVIMVLVSLAIIWKQYRQQTPQLDEEQLVGILIRRQSLSPAIAATSARQDDDQASNRPAPRLREHFRANSNNLLASALGLDGTIPGAVPLQPLNRLPLSLSQTASNPSIEPGRANVTPTDSPRSTQSASQHASVSHISSHSASGDARADPTHARASSSASR